MKKHPIDELFARKLAEHRQEPSQKAFEKFQARLQEKQTKRRGGVFAMNRNWGYYAAAAGIVAALTIGVLSQSNTNDPHIVVNDVKPKQVEKGVKQPVSPDNQGSSDVIAKIEVKKEPVNVEQMPLAKSANDNIAVAKRINIPVEAPLVKEIATPKVDESTDAIAFSQPEEVLANPLHAETLTGRGITEIETAANENTSIAAKYNIAETVVVIITPIEENTVQTPVETETPAEKAEKEKSFLAKLYGEYKHFKYGEKVDLKSIGVKDAMAKVDEGLFKEEREDVRDFMQRRIGRMQKRE